uniref:Uncharacterized protein n=1 Tax=Tetranychus urticae TaxID=32264 RepID=T1K296_TETUR
MDKKLTQPILISHNQLQGNASIFKDLNVVKSGLELFILMVLIKLLWSKYQVYTLRWYLDVNYFGPFGGTHI